MAKYIILSISIILVTIIAYYLTRKTPNNCITYREKDGEKSYFTLKMLDTDTTTQSLKWLCYPTSKKSESPIFMQLSYSGERRFAEQLESIEVKLYAKEANSENYTKEIMPFVSYVSCSITSQYYFGSPSRKANYQGNWCELINFKDQWNTIDRPNFFWLDKEFAHKDLPDEMKVVITIKWTSGEKQVSTLMQKIDMYCVQSIRTNPFG